MIDTLAVYISLFHFLLFFLALYLHILFISHVDLQLSAAGRPDESLSIEAIGPFWFSTDEVMQNRKLLSVSLHKGQLKANIFYQPHTSTNLEVL